MNDAPDDTRTAGDRYTSMRAMLAKKVPLSLEHRKANTAWDKASIASVIKEVLTEHGLKMPQLAMPVRVLVMGTAQTPSLDAVLSLCEKQKVLERLKNA